MIDIIPHIFSWISVIYLVAILSVATLATAQCPAVDPIDRTIHLPHERDCTKFYKCHFGVPELHDCPIMNRITGERLHFNRREEVCDWPNLAGCSGGPGPGPVDPCPRNTGGKAVKLPHETRCEYLYICIDGVKMLAQCPTGELFNRLTGHCDLPANVIC